VTYNAYIIPMTALILPELRNTHDQKSVFSIGYMIVFFNSAPGLKVPNPS